MRLKSKPITRVFFILTTLLGLIFTLPIVLSTDASTSSQPLINKVSIDKDIFNPTACENVSISFHLLKDAEASVKIFDFDWGLTAIICDDKMMKKGNNIVMWNGRAQNQEIVPDEAYFFTISVKTNTERSIYDPVASSSGISHEIEKGKIHIDSRQLEYYLPEKGRVFIRAGIHKGPLLAIPVDWEPRPKGWHKEHWDGMDQDKLFSLIKHHYYRIRASYFTLPDNTILTTGNNSINYLEYKRSQENPVSLRIPSASGPKSILTSPLHQTALALVKSPNLEVTYPQALIDKAGIPLLEGRFRIKIDFTQKWIPTLYQQKYELYYFLDNKFLMEEPQINLPHATLLDVGEDKQGTHILSVNIISPKGQIGIRSKRVKLK